MKQLKFVCLYSIKFLVRYRFYIVSSIIISVILFTGAVVVADKASVPVISEGVVGTYTEQNLPPVVTNLLSRSLVQVDSTGKPVPDLAASWEVNKDLTDYTFHLQNNLTWSDGMPLKASEINIPVPDIQASALDDKTINLKLSDSFSPLPTLLTNPVLKYPPHSTIPIGIGPYYISHIELSQVFISKITLDTLREDLPEVVIRFYPNEETAKEALRIGEVQSLLGVNQPGEFLADDPFAIIAKTNYQRLVAIFYKLDDPVVSDKNLREALSYATPSIKNQTRATTSISPLSWAYNPDLKNYLDNPKMAADYLSKVTNRKNLQITLTATENLQDVGSRIIDSWNKQGIKSSLSVESGKPQNFQALLVEYDIPADPDQYSLWHSTQKETNLSDFSKDPFAARVDHDLEDARKSGDDKVRLSDYQDLQKVLHDEAPLTPLYFAKFNIVYLKKVSPYLNRILSLQFPGLFN